MEEFLGDPGNRLDLWLEPGKIQILNNRVIVHGRTPTRTTRSLSGAGTWCGCGSGRGTAATSAGSGRLGSDGQHAEKGTLSPCEGPPRFRIRSRRELSLAGIIHERDGHVGGSPSPYPLPLRGRGDRNDSRSRSGGEGTEMAPSPSSIKRVGVRAETLASSGEARAERVRVAASSRIIRARVMHSDGALLFPLGRPRVCLNAEGRAPDRRDRRGDELCRRACRSRLGPA
jgi:hypothetical protein